MSHSTCTIHECDRPMLARGLCNAHYIRRRENRPMMPPIREHVFGRTCSVDGCERRSMARERCNRHYKQWQRATFWERIIGMKGGCCTDCGGQFPAPVYDLHHPEGGRKEFAIGSAIGNVSTDRLMAEAERCVLLCANCHRVRHAG